MKTKLLSLQKKCKVAIKIAFLFAVVSLALAKNAYGDCQNAIASAGSDYTICEGNDFQFTEAVASNYAALEWSTSGDGFFSSVNDLNPVYYPGANDILNGIAVLCLRAVAHSDCFDYSDCMVLSILKQPTAEIGGNQTVCSGDQVYLDAKTHNITSLIWSTSGDGIFNNINLGNPIYTPGEGDLINGSVELCLNVTAQYPCNPLSEICQTIVIEQNPSLNQISSFTICEIEPANLSAEAMFYDQIEWFTYGDGVFDSSNALFTKYYPGNFDIESGEVELCVFAKPKSPCNSAESQCFTLTIERYPFYSAGADTTICEEEMLYIIDSYAQFYDSLSWATTGDGTFNNPQSINPTYIPGTEDIENGRVQLIMYISTSNACSSTLFDVVNLQITLVPEISGLDDELHLNEQHYNRDAGEWQPIALFPEILNADSIQWSTDGDGYFDNPNAAQIIYHLDGNDRLAKEIVLTVEAFDLTKCDFYAIESITIFIPLQIIDVNGNPWTGLSSFIDKSETPVPDVVYPLVENGNLNIMINKSGHYYWPAANVNQLGNWQPIGYKAKLQNMDDDIFLPIYGEYVSDQTFEVGGPQLFTYVPVLTNYPVTIESIFGDHFDDILFIYDWKNATTWSYEASAIQWLMPGHAYLLTRKPGSDFFDIEFPPIDINAPLLLPVENSKMERSFYPPVWEVAKNTGSGHGFAVTLDANPRINDIPIQSGDWIGGFYLDEQGQRKCGGAVMWNDTANVMMTLLEMINLLQVKMVLEAASWSNSGYTQIIIRKITPYQAFHLYKSHHM
jgi:hypothetical protein